MLWIVIAAFYMGGVLAAGYEKTLDTQYGGISIFVEDKPITPWDTDRNIAKPFIFEGTTYLPVRAISEALGKQVRWDEETYSVYIEGEMEKQDSYQKVFPLANGDNYVGDIKIGIGWEEFQQKHADLIIDVSEVRQNLHAYFEVQMPGATLTFTNTMKQQSDGEFMPVGYILDDLYSKSDQYAFPRDIRVGDSIESVLLKFPIQKNIKDGYYYISDGEKFFEEEFWPHEVKRTDIYAMYEYEQKDGSNMVGIWASQLGNDDTIGGDDIAMMYWISYNTDHIVDYIAIEGFWCDPQENKEIQAQYNDISIYVDGGRITLTDANGNVVEPFIYDGTTYLPVRAISEALSKTVSWDEDTRSIYIR